jgi:hypothetical protein
MTKKESDKCRWEDDWTELDVMNLPSDWNPPDKWDPSSQMPKKFARIWLEITKVRIEPVQDIDPYEAWEEGFRCNGSIHPSSCAGNIEAFKNSWESRYLGSWARNDFVWVTGFKVVER